MLSQPEIIKSQQYSTVQPNDSTVRLLKSADSRPVEPEYKYVESVIDQSTGIHWWRLKATCPPKFTPQVVEELRRFQTEFANRMRNLHALGSVAPVPDYHVLTSDIEGIFNLGGDLGYFYNLIRNQDRAALQHYASACVELVYQNYTAMSLPMTTIALVKGNALGGGMEAALSAEIIVAERHVTMGLPEVLFNMFPGMGAYHFLSRRVAPREAERMILSGKTWTAEELYDAGVVDYLVESGEGEAAVERLVRKERSQSRAARAFRRAVRDEQPITREMLMRFVGHWVDTAMDLNDSDLGRMQYLIRSQRLRGI